MTSTCITYADILKPSGRISSIVYDSMLILAGSILIALSAKIAFPIPFSPVPVTGQTFAVLLTGALLGSRRGVLAVLAYMAEGISRRGRGICLSHGANRRLCCRICRGSRHNRAACRKGLGQEYLYNCTGHGCSECCDLSVRCNVAFHLRRIKSNQPGAHTLYTRRHYQDCTCCNHSPRRLEAYQEITGNLPAVIPA